ncbi:hypothetical protein A8F94_15190 [Bacillus sp. FJAT-27225]|uniref:DUF1648 domain-containing protein n=1 Tax=Bacillus sp. FJAT-27225 TaxID=1743144 RepID=UPI00080C24AA|nr:DUF1648 domain-containing protein [Bacillus sp. FJAT-27225]OCA84069.1 hypothetical protein A8F94_15190 [Bacillus sp. FJAT-27225]
MSNSWKRPKIKISKTKSEWIWDFIGYSFYIGSLIFLIYTWSWLPDKVPAHYNALGEVDRWGSKMELFILPIIGAFIALLMQLLEKFPESHNYPERFRIENAKEFYLISRKLANQLKNICLIIFALILIESVSIALGTGNGFGAWFLPIAIVSVLIPIVIGIIKQKKIK